MEKFFVLMRFLPYLFYPVEFVLWALATLGILGGVDSRKFLKSRSACLVAAPFPSFKSALREHAPALFLYSFSVRSVFNLSVSSV